MTDFIYDSIYEIEKHFVELWEIKFKDNISLYWMKDPKNFEIMCDYYDGNWAGIYDSIYDNFTIQETFEMLHYLDNNFIDYDVEDISGTIISFIRCVCIEYRKENDNMKYDYYVDASNKIKQWWKKIYWSPKTKVGIKRFNRECEKLGY